MKIRFTLLLLCLTLLLVAFPLHAQETACADGLRLIESELLISSPVCVPENPERVAAHDIATIELMLALDMQPVALPGQFVQLVGVIIPQFTDAMNALAADTVDTGGFSVNVEAMLQASPDLIIVAGYVYEEGLAEQLTQIAPTIAIRQDEYLDWKAYIRLLGDVLNRADEAEALLTAYETRVAALREASDGQFEGASISVVQTDAAGNIYLFLPGDGTSQVMNEVGFVSSDAQVAMAETMRESGVGSPQISTEQIGLLNTDYLVIIAGAYSAEDAVAIEAQFAAYQDDPLWRTLNAVQNNRFYLQPVAWQINGIISAEVVIDELFRDFLGIEPVIPNSFEALMNAQVEVTPEATQQ